MAEQTYTIAFEPHARRFVVTASGFWSMATVTAFAAECLARGAWARARYGRYAILVDARAMPVQGATVASAIETLVTKSIALSDAPYAFVAQSMLPKLQGDRVISGANCRTFLDMAQAEAWLAATWPHARAA